MNLRYYLKRAQKEGWALGQFNFSTLEQLKGIILAAKKLRAPIILGTSEKESKFFGLKESLALIKIAKVEHQIPLFLNLDHSKDLDWLKKAIDLKYELIHFDGSELSLDKNIKFAKKIVEEAHKKEVLVEGEVGYLREKTTKIKKKDLTKPEEVKKFVEETLVDSLTISIGNIHGIVSSMPKLDFERLKEIRKKTNAFLVLHGGSGISKIQIKKAIKLGIVKININTELRLAWRKFLEKSLRKNIKEIRPYKILPKVSEEIEKIVTEKIKLFGSVNKI